MKISAQEQGTSTTGKKRKKKLEGGLLPLLNYLMSTVH